MWHRRLPSKATTHLNGVQNTPCDRQQVHSYAPVAMLHKSSSNDRDDMSAPVDSRRGLPPSTGSGLSAGVALLPSLPVLTC